MAEIISMVGIISVEVQSSFSPRVFPSRGSFFLALIISMCLLRRLPSAVCCEEGSSNTPIMTDTNNGRLKMITNTLTLSQNVPGESAEAVNGVQMDNR